MRISTEVDGLGNLVSVQQRGVEGMRDQIIDLIQEAAREAEASMLEHVPRGTNSGNSDGTIAGSISVQSEPVFEPGGAGGGGFWRVAVGPGADAPQHLRFVLEGTGIHGPSGKRIKPQSASALQFSDGNFKAWSEGQKPNNLWLVRAQIVADAAVQNGITKLRFPMGER